MAHPMSRPATIVAALTVAAAVVASPASAQTKLASFKQATPVGAYRDTIAFSAYDPASKTYTLNVRQGSGPIRSVPVAPRTDGPFDANVGRGPSGQPLVIYSACPARRCGIYGLDPQTNRTRLLAHRASRKGKPFAVSVSGTRVAWAEGPGIYAARVGGTPRLVKPLKGRTQVGGTALLGHELALDVRPSGSDTEQIQVQTLGGKRRHVVGHTTTGEGGQSLVGLSFSGNALYWSRVCVEDPSGCGHGIAYQYRNGHYAHARVPVDLAGFAMATSGAYWVTENSGECFDNEGADATCDLEQASLSFVPGHDPFDGSGLGGRGR